MAVLALGDGGSDRHAAWRRAPACKVPGHGFQGGWCVWCSGVARPAECQATVVFRCVVAEVDRAARPARGGAGVGGWVATLIRNCLVDCLGLGLHSSCRLCSGGKCVNTLLIIGCTCRLSGTAGAPATLFTPAAWAALLACHTKLGLELSGKLLRRRSATETCSSPGVAAGG